MFFFVVGTQLDFSAILRAQESALFLTAILIGSILSKVIGGYIGARFVGIGSSHAMFFGVASTVQLTTSLAATQAGYALGIVDQTLFTSIVVLAVVSTVFSPFLLKWIRV